MRAIAALSVLAVLSACASAPPAVSPRPVPDAWTEASLGAAVAIDDRWWRGFDDPVLDAVMARIEDGDDVALAVARLNEALAGLRNARAALAPDLRITATGDTRKQGDDVARVDTASGGLAAAWTPDLFGQTRLRLQASKARAEASALDLRAVRLDARNAAAQLYFAYRDADGQRAAASRNVASLRETLSLVEARARAGLAPAFDVAQARAALAAAEARPPALARAATDARLGLEALIGGKPGDLATILGQGGVPAAPTSDPGLAPSVVLARRPDLLSAEASVVAAGSDARAARRDFWPRLSVSALVGAQTASPENFVTGSGAIYNATSQLAAPLFSFGRLEAARDAADSRRVGAEVAYRRRAINALVEVERALAARRDATERKGAFARALGAANDQSALARERYSAGLSPLLDVLVAERAVFDAEAQTVAAEADAARAYANLAAAMGLGGEASSRLAAQ